MYSVTYESEHSLYPEQITTERLVLEQFAPGRVSVAAVAELFGSGTWFESVSEWLTFDPHETRHDSHEFLTHLQSAWGSGDRASYAVRVEGADRLGGLATLETNWDRRIGQLGIVLHPDYWGSGYSAERAAALTGVAFEELALEAVYVSCHRDNERAFASVKGYINDLGGRYVGLLPNRRATRDGEPFDCHQFVISRDEYRDR